MNELSKSEAILNEYVLNTSEISSNCNKIYTQPSIKNNLNLKIISKITAIKDTPFKKYKSNFSLLINSIETNNIQSIINCLEKDPSILNIMNEDGLTPLHLAVIKGKIKIIP